MTETYKALQKNRRELREIISTTKELINKNESMVDIRLRHHLIRVLDGDLSQVNKEKGT